MTLAVGQAVALNPGVGLFLVDSGDGYHTSTQDASNNSFTMGVIGVVPLSEGAELDPSVSMDLYTVNNPDAVSGYSTDKYTSSIYSVGAKYLLSAPLGSNFRALGGLGGNLGIGSVTFPNQSGSVSRFTTTLLVPVALEYSPLAHLGLRLQASLASFSLSSYTNKDTSTSTSQTGTLSFGSSSVGMAAFYYF